MYIERRKGFQGQRFLVSELHCKQAWLVNSEGNVNRMAPCSKLHWLYVDLEKYLYLSRTFSGAKTFISEFHCEQAWEQWMSDSDNDVGKQKEGVLNCLKLIGNATTEDFFHQAVNALKGCDIWGENEKLRDWLNTFWLSKPEVSEVSMVNDFGEQGF